MFLTTVITYLYYQYVKQTGQAVAKFWTPLFSFEIYKNTYISKITLRKKLAFYVK